MITEDYVSFEVAKLLKEKGFDEQSTFMYDSQHKLYSVMEQCRQVTRNNSDWIHYVGKLNICPIAAPTLQMAMKWLREVHKECIIVYPIVTDDDGSAGCLWQCSILKLLKTQYKSAYAYEFYEQACEEAIRYCLINLI